MGSYERGNRAISMARAIEIANLFAIPLSELIEEPKRSDVGSGSLLILDLRKLRATQSATSDTEIPKLIAFVGAICARRRDWNGEVLTLRSGDLDTLTLLLEMTISEVEALLNRLQLLLKAPRN